jgi:hypothetical protein
MGLAGGAMVGGGRQLGDREPPPARVLASGDQPLSGISVAARIIA